MDPVMVGGVVLVLVVEVVLVVVGAVPLLPYHPWAVEKKIGWRLDTMMAAMKLPQVPIVLLAVMTVLLPLLLLVMDHW